MVAPVPSLPLPGLLDPAIAERLVRQGAVRVLDIRPPAEFCVSFIDGAISVPRDQLPGGASELNRSDAWLVVDEVGQFAPAMRDWLTALGFSRLYALRGGMADWPGPVASLTCFSQIQRDIDARCAPAPRQPADWPDPEMLRQIAAEMTSDNGAAWLPGWLLTPQIRKPSLRWW